MKERRKGKKEAGRKEERKNERAESADHDPHSIMSRLMAWWSMDLLLSAYWLFDVEW